MAPFLVSMDFAPSLGSREHVVEVVFVAFQLMIMGRNLAANGNSGFVYRVSVAGYQRMPPVKILAFINEPVGAGLREPIDTPNDFRGQKDAIRHLDLAVS